MADTDGTDATRRVVVRLAGKDGNPFDIVGRCLRAMRRAGIPQADVERFLNESYAGDYDHLLQTCVRWFDVR